MYSNYKSYQFKQTQPHNTLQACIQNTHTLIHTYILSFSRSISKKVFHVGRHKDYKIRKKNKTLKKYKL